MKKKQSVKSIFKTLAVGSVICMMIFTSACGNSTDGSSSGSSSDTKTASVKYNYVSPSDHSGDDEEKNDDEDKADDSSDKSDENKSSGQQNGSDSSNGQSSESQGQPPEPPGGSDGQNGQGQPPEPPYGSGNQNGQGQPPEMPSSQNGQGEVPGGGPDTATYDYSGSYSAALSVDGKEKSSDGEKLTSDTKDKNVVLVQNGGVLDLLNATLTKSGDDNDGDGCNFYGVNSSLLAVGEKTAAYIKDSSISSTSDGSNGIFATDSAKVYASGVTVKTTDSDNARGLDATYGGEIYGDDLDISTEGEHCAAIATDRGGGYISVTNSKLNTAGSGSPLIYSTGDIEVDNTTGTASGSQIAGMEGLNRIIISNSTLESTNDATSGSDPIKNGVIIYQSTSGDADTSTDDKADFEVIDSTLKTSISDGAMFYVTNTTAEITLSNSTLEFDSMNVDFLDAVGNDSNNWGTSGSNGGKADVTCNEQTVAGDIKVDSISSAELSLTNGSSWTGTVKGDITKKNVEINVSEDSTWTVTADCTVSGLEVEDGGKVVDADGKTVTIKSGSETLVKGDSDITVTVKGEYSAESETDANETITVDVLDRAGFDNKYETTTTFGENK